jgi:hypothetical protein
MKCESVDFNLHWLSEQQCSGDNLDRSSADQDRCDNSAGPHADLH